MTTTDIEPTRWRKKPVEIEAVQFTGHNYDRIASWMGAAATTKDLLTRLQYMEDHRSDFPPEDVSLIRDAAKRATKALRT